MANVAVIIVSHDYGRFLGDAIESVLAQTLRPVSITVVDDASSDETNDVALRYTESGVSYLRGEWRNVGRARNAALQNVRSEFLVFLDADDRLHPDYCKAGVAALQSNPFAAIAYPDHQCFGLKTDYLRRPDPFDWRLFDRSNHMSAASMVRRDALMQAGSWCEAANQHADWITWRRILALGWTAVRSDGVHFYRLHESNMHKQYERTIPYAERAGFLTEPTTFCLSLSGRHFAWPLMRKFLEEQAFPHNLVHLIILDTSHDAAFTTEIRSWIAACDYPNVTVLQKRVARNGIADLPREEVAQEVRDACATIYNTFARQVRTPLVLFLEDDVIPPADVFHRLVSNMTYDTLSVSAHYRHRHRDQAVVWNWTGEAKPVDAPDGTGVQQVGGNGFGCVVMRGEFVRRSVFRSTPPLWNFDQDFYRTWVVNEKHEALLDWDCRCKHLLPSGEWR